MNQRKNREKKRNWRGTKKYKGAFDDLKFEMQKRRKRE